MERSIEPIEPVNRTKAVYKIHPLKMDHHRRQQSKFSQILTNIERNTKKSPSKTDNEDQNPAGIGEHIDFKAWDYRPGQIINHPPAGGKSKRPAALSVD